MVTPKSKLDNLPSFKNPPLIEVALSVQFDPITKLQSVQIGLLWSSKYRDKYPRTEQHPNIASAFEQYNEINLPKRELRLILEMG